MVAVPPQVRFWYCEYVKLEAALSHLKELAEFSPECPGQQ